MADTNEALKIWEAIRPMIDKEIADQTESCVRAKKMIVKQATMETEDGSVRVGVAEPYDTKIVIPSGTQLSNVNPGSPVWVYWYMNNASTMHVALNGDGSPGTADTDRLEDLLNQEIENREKAIRDLESALEQTTSALYSYIDYTASNLRI